MRRLRKPALVLACLLLVFLPGCVVMSVQPFYTGKDLVFDKELLGTWKYEDKEDTLLFRKAPDDSYFIVSYEDGKAVVYRAYLFELLKTRYFDVTQTMPEDAKDTGHFIGVHTIWKVEMDGDTLRIVGINEAKLKDILRDKPMPWADPDYKGDVLLTGTTEEIQDFLKRNPTDLFEDEGGVWKREKP